MKTYNFRITIEQDEDGIYVATCPALHGCHTQGRTYEEVVSRIEEAVSLYIDVLKKRKKESVLSKIKQSKFIAWQDIAVSV